MFATQNVSTCAFFLKFFSNKKIHFHVFVTLYEPAQINLQNTRNVVRKCYRNVKIPNRDRFNRIIYKS